MLKTFIKALDKVIYRPIAMVINENYNSNMYCCMNNKQLIQLYTPNSAIWSYLTMLIPPKQRKHISKTCLSLLKCLVYIMSRGVIIAQFLTPPQTSLIFKPWLWPRSRKQISIRRECHYTLLTLKGKSPWDLCREHDDLCLIMCPFEGGYGRLRMGLTLKAVPSRGHIETQQT